MAPSNHIPFDQTSSSLEAIAAIKSPDRLLITGPEQTPIAFGCDQDWYQSRWQRQAGCGPCTSATILYYLSATRKSLAALFPYPSFNYDTMNVYMHNIWHFVTPGLRGVNDASILVNGICKYAATLGIELEASIFPVPAKPAPREPFQAWFDSIKEALECDIPVAFLNLSRGHLKNLDSWHWVTVTALFLKNNQILAEIADSGERKMIDIMKWYQSSRLGGATVYFRPDRNARSV